MESLDSSDCSLSQGSGLQLVRVPFGVSDDSVDWAVRIWAICIQKDRLSGGIYKVTEHSFSWGRFTEDIGVRTAELVHRCFDSVDICHMKYFFE